MASRQINLPDGEHVMVIYESDYDVSFDVYHRVTYRTRQRLRFDKKETRNWAELIGIAEDLAKKTYALDDLFKRRRKERGW